MSENVKRATIYFEEALHHALRIKAAQLKSTISDIVNEAVRSSLLEDAEDIQSFKDRANEPELAFEDVLKELKDSGKI